MGAGASAAAEIEEFQLEQNKRISEEGKHRIRSFALERGGDIDAVSRQLNEVLRLNRDDLPTDVKEFLAWELNKIATEIAMSAIQQATSIVMKQNNASTSAGEKEDEEGSKFEGKYDEQSYWKK